MQVPKTPKPHEVVHHIIEGNLAILDGYTYAMQPTLMSYKLSPNHIQYEISTIQIVLSLRSPRWPLQICRLAETPFNMAISIDFAI